MNNYEAETRIQFDLLLAERDQLRTLVASMIKYRRDQDRYINELEQTLSHHQTTAGG